MRSALIALLIVVALAAPASAHNHPSGSADRVTPGAVRVEVTDKVSITLFDDRAALKRFTKTYDVPVGSGSGFTVSPDGVVVTATEVVQNSSQDPKVYAANKVFAEYFKKDVPGDFSKHTTDGGDLNSRLQACYPPYNDSSTCSSTVTPVIKIFPFTTPAMANGMPATLVKAGSSPSAPAVIKVTKGGESGTLPTVPLATTFGGGVAASDVMAFKGRPSATVSVSLETAHFDPPGSKTLKNEDIAKIQQLLANGGIGGAVIDDNKSEVVAVISGGVNGKPIAFAPAQDIQAALTSAGVSARRGPVDVVFDSALAQYHDRFYSLSIPVLQQVLKLRPDHAVAIDHLRNAQSWKGTDKEAKRPAQGGDESEESGLINTWTLSSAALLVIALGAGVYLIRRPRRADADADSGPTQAFEPAGRTVLDGRFSPASHPQTPPPGVLAAPGVPPPGASYSQGGQVAAARREPSAGDHPEYCTQCGMRRGRAHRFCGFCGHPADA
jgi:hypothetical protein